MEKHVNLKDDIDALAKLKEIRNSNNRPVLTISNKSQVELNDILQVRNSPVLRQNETQPNHKKTAENTVSPMSLYSNAPHNRVAHRKVK